MLRYLQFTHSLALAVDNMKRIVVICHLWFCVLHNIQNNGLQLVSVGFYVLVQPDQLVRVNDTVGLWRTPAKSALGDSYMLFFIANSNSKECHFVNEE